MSLLEVQLMTNALRDYGVMYTDLAVSLENFCNLHIHLFNHTVHLISTMHQRTKVMVIYIAQVSAIVLV